MRPPVSECTRRVRERLLPPPRNLLSEYGTGDHFFGKPVAKPTRVEAFVSLERIANMRSRLLVPRTNELLRKAVEKRILTQSEACEAVQLYRELVVELETTVEDPKG